MQVTLNGRQTEIDAETSIETFVAAQFNRTDGIIAEVNGEVVNRGQWPGRLLRSGDDIQLIQFVGGG